MNGTREGTGIRGWLLLFLIVLTLWCAGGIWAAVLYFPAWIENISMSASGRIHPLIVIGGLADLGVSIATFVYFIQRRHETRILMIIASAIALALLAALAILPPHILRGGPAMLAAAALLYFLRSQRVKSTFVR